VFLHPGMVTELDYAFDDNGNYKIPKCNTQLEFIEHIGEN